MDNRPPRHHDFDIDLENGTGEATPDPLTIKVVIDSKVEGEITGKKKSKNASPSAKKPPKPPRPTKGFSLDAADQKLIKDLTELAKMKRASIQRMKTFKQNKALKASSSSSMSGSFFAMLFTIIFFLMMLFQGMSCRSSGVTSHGSSPQTAQTNENVYLKRFQARVWVEEKYSSCIRTERLPTCIVNDSSHTYF